MGHGIAHLVDVGSTWTKGVAVAIDDGRLLARHQHPTTVASDIMIGVRAVLAALTQAAPGQVELRAASSSAAGGLRVAAIGLVPDLTGLAARQASLGAGARVVFTGAYHLAPEEIDAMRAARPDILLLCGGTDGGNTEVIIANAERIAASGLVGGERGAAVVVAGNKSARAQVVEILRKAGAEVHAADNVLPTIDRMNVDSAQAAIRQVFLERIVVARGIESLREWADGQITPTPRAVLDAAELLADGPHGFGTTVIVDIGGATTDVHSIGGEAPESGVLLQGLPEPRVKRTVEGDLGLRVSATAATDVLGLEALAKRLGIAPDALRDEAAQRVEEPGRIAADDPFDRVVTIAAVGEAVIRHTGRLERLPLNREGWMQIGKDLRHAKMVIGSGGVFAARPDALELLRAAIVDARARSDRLLPDADAALAVDRDYVLFAVGLLAPRYPEAARALANSSLAQRQRLA